MTTIKYLNKDNEWVDYVEKSSGILVFNGDTWVDGDANEVSPALTVNFYDGHKWVRKYPNAQVLYTHKLTANNLKYTHTKNSSTTWGSSTPLNAKAGKWSTDAVYFGWLGLTKPSSIAGGVGNVDEIVDIKCNYTRYGVGYWENPLLISLVPSTLTKASGTGTTTNNSKRGTTIKSDTGMVLCSSTGQQVKGSTTFNNTNAKNEFKKFLNGSYGSLLLGYKEASGDYIGLTALEINIVYSCKVSSATFRVEDSKLLSSKYTRKKTHEMFIYDNEIGLSYDEIMKKREKENIKDIKLSDVSFI